MRLAFILIISSVLLGCNQTNKNTYPATSVAMELKQVSEHVYYVQGKAGIPIDNEGFIYIVDRKKDMIISEGFNIYPNEIDEVVLKHPKVFDAAAVGMPDRLRGEKVMLYVVLKEGEVAGQEEIVGFCRENLAKYKVPKKVEFRKELPKTPVGKVLRRVLREEAIKGEG